MTAIDEADKLAPCPAERDEGYYWVRHIRPDAPWQPMEYLGDGRWLAADCDGIVREFTLTEVGPRFFAPDAPEAAEAAAQALRERGWTVVEPSKAGQVNAVSLKVGQVWAANGVKVREIRGVHRMRGVEYAHPDVWGRTYWCSEATFKEWISKRGARPVEAAP